MKKRDELIHKEKLDVAAAAAGKIYIYKFLIVWNLNLNYSEF